MRDYEPIIDVLCAQRDLYMRLQEVLQKERKALVSFNHEEIEEIAKEKDSLVLQAQLLEEQRKRLVDEFFQDSSTPKGIMDLYEETGDERFRNLRFALISLLQAIQEANEVNRYFIERAFQHIHGGLSFLQQYIQSQAGTTLSREA
ncbi:MAG: flagellar protein FlgN [Nitrospirae bacterium]|nr:MAG: flagellar protein FlgN [Nitrospirota bacterium]